MSKLKVLILCTGNSCRSQMAHGFGNTLKGDTIEFVSAGVETHGLNPNAVKVMKEAGVDISTHESELVDKYIPWKPDYVISVCSHAAESCPAFPGETRRIHYGFDDPPALAKALAADGASEEEQLEPYRRVRDEIKAFISTLPDALESLYREQNG